MILLFPFANPLPTGNPNPKSPPIDWWRRLVALINDDITQIGVSGQYQLVTNFKKDCSILELAEYINTCDTWIGIDSFGQHLCWSLKKFGIVVWGQSNPSIFGHQENINLLKDTKYLMPNQFLKWEQVPYRYDCFVEPEEVVQYISIFKK